MLYIYSYNQNSKGARLLAEALEIRRLKSSTYATLSAKSTVINWGSSILPDGLLSAKIINDSKTVGRTTDKLRFFSSISKINPNIQIPPFTKSGDEALRWIREGHTVVGRQLTRASGGDGIIFFDKDNLSEWIACPLYTKYIKKKEEFRVHFAFRERIDIQQKKLRKVDDAGEAIDPKTIDFRLRNHSNGFIFARTDIRVPDDVVHQAELSFTASGLHFGAVDVIWNEHENKAYVLEINTAPGLEGQTVENYATAFRKNLK